MFRETHDNLVTLRQQQLLADARQERLAIEARRIEHEAVRRVRHALNLRLALAR